MFVHYLETFIRGNSTSCIGIFLNITHFFKLHSETACSAIIGTSRRNWPGPLQNRREKKLKLNAVPIQIDEHKNVVEIMERAWIQPNIKINVSRFTCLCTERNNLGSALQNYHRFGTSYLCTKLDKFGMLAITNGRVTHDARYFGLH